ncbi:MAG: hypothetical protein H6Q64_814 [Firmicutes bacterium]|nr:hypothetical protein [Bacillota bacterium]
MSGYKAMIVDDSAFSRTMIAESQRSNPGRYEP